MFSYGEYLSEIRKQARSLMRIKKLLEKLTPNSYSDKKKYKKDGRDLNFHSRSSLCPICGYEGVFRPWFGMTLVRDNACPSCDSHPRQRLFWLWFQGDKSKLDEPILHFAPEKSLSEKFKSIYSQYQTADLYAKADLKLNIENINLDSCSYNTIICNHVLEHVDDLKAIQEMYRVLSDKGILVCSVPLIEGWETTYENSAAVSEADKELHFDQRDHVRYYGRDFRDRLKNAGFTRVEEVTAYGEDAVKYGLIRGEKFFLCSKG